MRNKILSPLNTNYKILNAYETNANNLVRMRNISKYFFSKK